MHQIKLSNSLILSTLQVLNAIYYVSKFFQDNLTSIEFFPFHFLVKNLETRTPMVHGQSRDGL